MENERQIINRFMDNMELFIKNAAIKTKKQIRIKHTFAPGVYTRKAYIPKGAVLTSKVHNTEHVFIVSKGRILVYDGVHEAVILKASYDGVTMPGTRRMGIAITDTIWINIHPTDIHPTDNTEEALKEALDKIESLIIEPYENLLLNK